MDFLWVYWDLHFDCISSIFLWNFLVVGGYSFEWNKSECTWIMLILIVNVSERAWSWEDVLKWLNYLVSPRSLPQSQTSVIVTNCLQLLLKFGDFSKKLLHNAKLQYGKKQFTLCLVICNTRTKTWQKLFGRDCAAEMKYLYWDFLPQYKEHQGCCRD